MNFQFSLLTRKYRTVSFEEQCVQFKGFAKGIFDARRDPHENKIIKTPTNNLTVLDCIIRHNLNFLLNMSIKPR